MNTKVIVGIIIGVIIVTSIVFALSYTSTEEITGVEDSSEISDSLETITDSEAEEEEHITLELSDDVATTAKP